MSTPIITALEKVLVTKTKLKNRNANYNKAARDLDDIKDIFQEHEDELKRLVKEGKEKHVQIGNAIWVVAHHTCGYVEYKKLSIDEEKE